jgi:two-component system, cell cycle sensor histidine kinase and response regulator CckA
MLLNSLAEDSRPRSYALEILRSTEKASALTRQLLAFIRRQVTHPAPLDINPLIANLGSMLRRLIGEDIEIVILPSQNMATVRVNPSQIEQIVMNLAVNARDAMPGGGRITIETGLADLGEDRAETHFNVQPGRYVSIAVTDTGHGMTQKIRSRIFEPFFTTKGQVDGTGLGLATIYGIVKQNHGDIWVYSEPGKGSTFKVYLPAVDELAEPRQGAENRILHRGMETILVAEDDAGLRLMTQEMLERLGYKVLIAESSQEAIRIASIHPGPIHLLLTDVMMRNSNGRELAEKLGYLRRQTRVLYMSGYPSETVVQHGVLGAGVSFLEKPFTLESLARKVREALDA